MFVGGGMKDNVRIELFKYTPYRFEVSNISDSEMYAKFKRVVNQFLLQFI
jgi:hypothetical protein